MTKISPQILRNDLHRAACMQIISKLDLSNDPYTITISQGDESRSNKQNRLSFLWYQCLGGLTANGMVHQRRYCKLHYGVPIMRQDADFQALYDATIKPMTYEKKIQVMELLPVTSMMTVHQFAEYLTTIDQESAALGFVLPHPEDLYSDALMQYEAQNKVTGELK